MKEEKNSSEGIIISEDKKIITENIIEPTGEMSAIVESKIGGNKTYFLEGICMQAEIINGNRRKYQKWEMEREIEKYNLEKIANNASFGELDHPDSSIMNLSKMSHLFIEPLYMEGNDVICKAKILETIWGQIVKVAIDEGIPFGFSSRGRGNVVEKDDHYLVNNFELVVPADIVETPSAPGARPSAFAEMVTEAIVDKDKIITNVLDDQLVEIVRNNVRNSKNSERDAIIIQEFNRIVKEINNK